MNTYARLPVAFTHGKGSYLYDTTGRDYLDALSGIAVSTLGHAHPALVAAISAQAGRVLHTSNIYKIPAQEKLAENLTKIAGMDAAFFCNSGLEANEAAIKLARFYGNQRGMAKEGATPTIVVMDNAFHGRSMATLSATGNKKTQAGFEPLVQGFVRVPYNDLAAIEAIASQNKNIIAVMLEVLQGEGGVRLADAAYLRALRALCDDKGWLLICDEVQCGMGRTGKWFAFQHAGILPDIVTLAKGLGSGVPIGACLARGKAATLWQPGNHGSTFGGNPLACVAAQTTIETIEKEKLLENAINVGIEIRDDMAAALAGVAGVVAIRGHGLMIGIELNKPAAALVEKALDAGLLINVTAEKVVRLLPPLIFTSIEAKELVARLAPLIKDFLLKP